jgi:hypothetical protein
MRRRVPFHGAVHRCWRWTVWLVLCVFVASPSWAQPGLETDPLSFDRNISGLFSRYCYHCHNDSKARGDVNLKKDDNPRLILENMAVWETAREQIEGEAMPPDDAKQPSQEERELMVKFLDKTLKSLDCNGPIDPGPLTIRRLNRAEYNNSIRHLTTLDLRLADSFPVDASSYGFDNIAASLTLTPLQVEQYYHAAKSVVEAVLKSKNEGSQAAYHTIFLDTNIDRAAGSQDDGAGARRIIEKFATRAFRRPVEQDYIDKLMRIYDSSIEQKCSHDDAVGHMISAVLISPRFLMRAEEAKPEVTEAFKIDDFDLASRLSFFLWSGPPDDLLLELAAAQKLSQPEVLDQQITRMLEDDRSDALIDNFFAPWLQFAGLQSRKPDSEAFPHYSAALHEAILKEPRLAIAEIIRKNRPVTELIDADYTYVNQTLASHYGLSDIAGDQMQRVTLNDRRRGGLLTSAAILMAQADPGRTNVPRRGSFLTGTILGVPAPPPPPDVPALKETDGAAAPKTLRERLEEHRSNPQCASCHAKIDPLGFAFENYDAIGGWREQEVGKAIDASGQLPDGRSFRGPVELKDILLEGKDDFTRTLASQMLIFALGRGPVPTDKCVIDDVVQQTQNGEYRLGTMVRAIITSAPFLHRRNPEF